MLILIGIVIGVVISSILFIKFAFNLSIGDWADEVFDFQGDIGYGKNK